MTPFVVKVVHGSSQGCEQLWRYGLMTLVVLVFFLKVWVSKWGSVKSPLKKSALFSRAVNESVNGSDAAMRSNFRRATRARSSTSFVRVPKHSLSLWEHTGIM